jgi:hypothetical protein
MKHRIAGNVPEELEENSERLFRCASAVRLLASFVGWVERSETHHYSHGSQLMGFASAFVRWATADKSLYPSYVEFAHSAITGSTVGLAWDDARPACGTAICGASSHHKK